MSIFFAEHDFQLLVITAKDMVGKSLKELKILKNYGCIVTQITRIDVEFVPNRETTIELNDIIRAVGDQDGLQKKIFMYIPIHFLICMQY